MLQASFEDRRQQDVLAALHRIGVDAEQRRAGSSPSSSTASAHPLGVVALGLGRRRERLEDRDWHARRGCPACRSRSRRRRAAARCARRPGPSPRAPSSTSRLPARRTRRRSMPLRAASSASTHGSKSRRRQVREREQQVAEIALRIDRDRRDAVDRRFLEQRRGTSPVLPLPVMPTHDGVRDQVLGVVEDQLVPSLFVGQVVRLAEVEDAEFFVERGRGRCHGRILVPGAPATRGPVRRSAAGALGLFVQ